MYYINCYKRLLSHICIPMKTRSDAHRISTSLCIGNMSFTPRKCHNMLQDIAKGLEFELNAFKAPMMRIFNEARNKYLFSVNT